MSCRVQPDSLLGSLSESPKPWESVCLDIPPPHKGHHKGIFVTPITALTLKHSFVCEPDPRRTNTKQQEEKI